MATRSPPLPPPRSGCDIPPPEALRSCIPSRQCTHTRHFCSLLPDGDVRWLQAYGSSGIHPTINASRPPPPLLPGSSMRGVAACRNTSIFFSGSRCHARALASPRRSLPPLAIICGSWHGDVCSSVHENRCCMQGQCRLELVAVPAGSASARGGRGKPGQPAAGQRLGREEGSTDRGACARASCSGGHR